MMLETIPSDLASALEDLKREMAALSERVAKLEHPDAAAARVAASPLVGEPLKTEPKPDLTEEELLAISGALAAYFGVRVHIRQIRLISSSAWAQVGRVFIQASHRLHGQERA
jgi:methylmalonyl-CoA carboxyltransferase 12S subunit